MKEDTFRRENLIYSATPNSRSDLVTGKGLEMTKEDIWEKISQLLDIGHWATNRQLQIWIRDYATDRYSTIEELYKEKVDRGDLRMDHYGKPKVYAKPIKTRGAKPRYRPYLKHEISCMECYIRFQKSRKGAGIPSGDFKGFGVVPDFGIEYLTTVLLCEFETSTDLDHHKRLEGKVTAYINHWYEIEEAYKIPVIVLFILDVPRERVQRFVEEHKPDGPIRFVDYETFVSQKIGNALSSHIYIYPDGSVDSL